MLITPETRQKLLERGVSFLHPGQFSLPDNCVFEPPCSLKRVQVAHSLQMGAFSYAKTGYFFATRIGRYCSIDDNVQIGRGSHPVGWGSTSPVLYQDHVHVFNQKFEAANGFLVNGKTPSAKITSVGNDVHIGYGALINQGVTIGDGAVIKPMAVVAKDVPPFAIIEGNPGVIVGMRFGLEVASKMQEAAWWRYAFWDMSDVMINDVEKFIDRICSLSESSLTTYNPIHVRLIALINSQEGI